jgi:polyphosphate kinase
VLGRFLEHSRAYWFENGGEPEVWIGSADMMHRNLDRRVEVLVRVPGESEVASIAALLDLAFDPDTDAWCLDSDGSWKRSHGRVHLQERLIERQRRRRTA